MIALKNAGIENVVYMVEGSVSHDPVTRRTLFGLSREVVCPFDSEGIGPRAAYELLDVHHTEANMVRLMRVPSGSGVLGLLAEGGAAAVASAIAAAVLLEQWMGELLSFEEEGAYGMAAAVHSANRGPGGFAHASHAQ